MSDARLEPPVAEAAARLHFPAVVPFAGLVLHLPSLAVCWHRITRCFAVDIRSVHRILRYWARTCATTLKRSIAPCAIPGEGSSRTPAFSDYREPHVVGVATGRRHSQGGSATSMVVGTSDATSAVICAKGRGNQRRLRRVNVTFAVLRWTQPGERRLVLRPQIAPLPGGASKVVVYATSFSDPHP